MITRYIKGDITETELKYIAHGVSCSRKNTEVTKRIFSKYPNNKAHYNHVCRDNEIVDRRIGISFGVSVVKKYYSIFTMFTQLKEGTPDEIATNAAAIVQCFKHFTTDKPASPVAIPKTGWGIEDWSVVEKIINDTVGDKAEFWVYEE